MGGGVVTINGQKISINGEGVRLKNIYQLRFCDFPKDAPVHCGFLSIPIPQLVQQSVSGWTGLIAGIGDVGYTGIYYVNMSCTYGIFYDVQELYPMTYTGNHASIQFAHWTENNRVYFGLRTSHWCNPVFIYELSRSIYYSDIQLDKFLESITQPEGWTPVDIRKMSTTQVEPTT